MVTVCNFAQQPLLVNLNRAKYVVLCLKSSPNLVTVEIRPIHVVWINLNAILVHEKLSQHRLLASNTYWRCRGCCACFDEHTFFKALSLVLASSVTAVLDYNSPKCHKIIILSETICRTSNPYSKCSIYSIFLFPIRCFHVTGNNKKVLCFTSPSQKNAFK